MTATVELQTTDMVHVHTKAMVQESDVATNSKLIAPVTQRDAVPRAVSAQGDLALRAVIGSAFEITIKET